jgi:tetratricopeptide (TPR) repeat protein
MRKSRNVSLLVVLACGLFVIGGCGSDKNAASIQAVTSKQAAEMTASRTEFDSSEEPPLKAETHFAAGQLNETQGALPLAAEQYEAALKLNPKYIPALFRLGLVYSEMKQYEQAIAIWNRYIEVTEDSAIGYSNLAFCQELSGNRKAAEESYEAGIERDPKNQPCRVNYGLMLARAGRIDEARSQFAAVLTPAQVHYNIASVLQQQGKKEAARAEFKEAIKTDPKFMDAAVRLADLDRN